MENIKSYLDGELDLAQQTEVETHLRNDAELQQMVDEFRAISATLKTADTGEPYGAEALEAKLTHAKTAKSSDDKKIWRIATYWSGAAVCFALIGITLVPMMKSMSSSMGDAAAGGAVMSKSLSTSSEASAKSAGAPSEGDELQRRPLAERPQVSGGLAMPRAGGVDGFKGSAEVENQVAEEPKPQDMVSEDKAAPKLKSADADQLSSAGKFDTGAGRGGGGSAANGRSQDYAKAPYAGDTTSQWYDKNARKSEPESKIKQEGRQYMNQNQGPTSITETPHGMYLERIGTMQVAVENLDNVEYQVTGMVQSFKGYVVSSNVDNKEEGGVATMKLKVPSENFGSAMEKLKAMGQVIATNSSSNDITGETVDSSSRMVTWADEEKRLVEALEKAKTSQEKYYLRQQITEVRANLNAYRAQVKNLTDRANMSTIDVTFLRGDKADKAGSSVGGSNWSGTAFKDAKSGLGTIGQGLGIVAIYAMVFSPVWLPFVIAAYIIKKKNS